MREALRLRSRHDRAVAALAIPALGSLVADPLLSLVDTAFVGRLGSDSLAGLGIAAALFSLVRSGDHILVADNIYEPVRKLAGGMFKRLGITCSFFDSPNWCRNRRAFYRQDPGRIRGNARLSDLRSA